MVKKIKKYLKFVVCCALIMSLVAPSYAALSASDGSAFVTKAEFDSALADFNARLTTFEAGINSKIDSQVTSYLDRNGIWSGKEQPISNEFIWKNFTVANIGQKLKDATTIEGESAYHYQEKLGRFLSYTENFSYDEKYVGVDPVKTLDIYGRLINADDRHEIFLLNDTYPCYVELVHECTKSGLFFLDWEISTLALNLSCNYSKEVQKTGAGNFVNDKNCKWHPMIKAIKDAKTNGRLAHGVSSYATDMGNMPYEGLFVTPSVNTKYYLSLDMSLWADCIRNGTIATSLQIQTLPKVVGFGNVYFNNDGLYGIGETVSSNWGTNVVQSFFVSTGDNVKVGVNVHANGRGHDSYMLVQQYSKYGSDPSWWAGYFINSAKIY